jgi:PAS domain-containing protein
MLHQDSSTLAAIMGDEQAARVLASLREAERFNGELAVGVDGTHRLIDTTAITVKNHDGKVACHVALSRDVTEKRKAEDGE